MNLGDFFPHLGFCAQPSFEGTFAQALTTVGVVRYKLQTLKLQDTESAIVVVGRPSHQTFLRQLSEVYIGLLVESRDPHDQRLRRRFTPEQIQASVTNLISYIREKEPGQMSNQDQFISNLIIQARLLRHARQLTAESVAVSP